MGLRLRLPELLEERGLTPWKLAKESKGRISETAAFRYARNQGRMRYFDAEMLEVLCELLGIDGGPLFERDSQSTGKKKKSSDRPKD
jgi:hypothetical protein